MPIPLYSSWIPIVLYTPTILIFVFKLKSMALIKKILKPIALILVIITGNANIIAQENDTLEFIDSRPIDSIPIGNKPESQTTGFKLKQLITPGSLIAVGVFGVYNGAFGKLNKKIRTEMTNLRSHHYCHIDDYLQYIPAATYLFFNELGIKSKHSIKERVAVETTAYISMGILTVGGKCVFREKRPDSNDRNSFPSGHCAKVFTGAELMREEYGLWPGVGAYTVATGVAFLRLYNGRHWLNDVIAGAGVGILSARIGYWMLPLYRKWFKWDAGGRTNMAIAPSYDPQKHALSLNLALTLH